MRFSGILTTLVVVIYASNVNLLVLAADCAQTESAISVAITNFLNCVSNATTNTVNFCPAGWSGSACGCSKCQADFDQAVISYGILKGDSTCSPQDFRKANVELIAQLSVSLQHWHCFAQRKNCNTNTPLCENSAVLVANKIAIAGKNAILMCLDAISLSCEANNPSANQPFCKCNNGICTTIATNSSGSFTENVGIFELTCSSTGRYNKNMVMSPTTVSIQSSTNTSDREQLSPEWSNAPVIWVDKGKVAREGHPDFKPLDLADVWASTPAEGGRRSSMSDVMKLVIQGGALAESPSTDQDAIEHPAGAPGFLSQTFSFLERSFVQRYRDPGSSVIFLAVHMVCAVALGVGFMQGEGRVFVPPLPASIANFCPPAIKSYCVNEPLFWVALMNATFFVSLALGAAAIVSSIQTFGGERAVQQREWGSGCRLASYVLGKCLADLPWIVVGSCLFVSVFMVMFQPFSSFGNFYAIFVAVEYAAYGLGYWISVMVSMNNASIVGVVSIFAMCVCSGLSPRLALVHENMSVLRVVWDLSFPRYAAEAIYISEASFYLQPSTAWLNSTRNNLDFMGYKEDNFAFDIGITFLLGTAFRILTYAFMYYKSTRKM
eukprot:Colp12_sorted_trinity150504_noHs@2855